MGRFNEEKHSIMLKNVFFKRRKMKNDSYENMVYVDDFVCDALWAKMREKNKKYQNTIILIHFTLEVLI